MNMQIYEYELANSILQWNHNSHLFCWFTDVLHSFYYAVPQCTDSFDMMHVEEHTN